jgi:hypothetical protein
MGVLDAKRIRRAQSVAKRAFPAEDGRRPKTATFYGSMVHIDNHYGLRLGLFAGDDLPLVDAPWELFLHLPSGEIAECEGGAQVAGYTLPLAESAPTVAPTYGKNKIASIDMHEVVTHIERALLATDPNNPRVFSRSVMIDEAGAVTATDGYIVYVSAESVFPVRNLFLPRNAAQALVALAHDKKTPWRSAAMYKWEEYGYAWYALKGDSDLEYVAWLDNGYKPLEVRQILGEYNIVQAEVRGVDCAALYEAVDTLAKGSKMNRARELLPIAFTYNGYGDMLLEREPTPDGLPKYARIIPVEGGSPAQFMLDAQLLRKTVKRLKDEGTDRFDLRLYIWRSQAGDSTIVKVGVKGGTMALMTLVTDGR